MGISGVNNPGSVAQTNSLTKQSPVQDKTQLGKDDFMKLLIAQLKNQDPEQPVDAKEMVTQLAQLGSVEQMTNMVTEMKSLQLATTSMANHQASSLVGKSIEANGSKLYLGDAGGAASGINLTLPAETVTLTVRDDKGQVVRTIEQSKTPAGISAVSWDGNNDNGERMPKGQYTLTVEAKNKDGGPVVADAKIRGLVSSVSYEQGFPELVVGEARVALANVTSIKQ
ncbi:MAG TPA: FlgD immunoglobulin-like domain containing protein [Polyangiales bacterium]